MPPRPRRPTTTRRDKKPDENNVVQLADGPRARRRAVGNGNPTGEKAIRARERKAYALQLKRQGANFVKIAEMIAGQPQWGVPRYTKGDAHHDVMDTLYDIVAEPAREVLAEELDRLNTALMAIWPSVLKGNLGAVDRMLKIQHQRAQYLGLYTPEKLILTGPDGGPVQLQDMSDPAELRNAAMMAMEQVVADAKTRAKDIVDAEVVDDKAAARRGKQLPAAP